MTEKRIRCKSGLMGWQARLRDNYCNDFDQFASYSRIYGIAEQLGYKTPEDAWEDNPLIESSADPTDFRKVETPQVTPKEPNGLGQ